MVSLLGFDVFSCGVVSGWLGDDGGGGLNVYGVMGVVCVGRVNVVVEWV